MRVSRSLSSCAVLAALISGFAASAEAVFLSNLPVDRAAVFGGSGADSATASAAGTQTTTFTNLQAFAQAAPQQRAEGFDRLTAGALAPLLTPGVVLSGVEFPNAPSISSDQHSTVFQGQASPPNYVLVNWRDFALVFAHPTRSLGMTLQCVGCDSSGAAPSRMRIELRNGDDVVGVDEVTTAFDSTVRFVGVVSAQAFDRAFVTRLQPSGVGNYMLDDVRFDDGFLANGFEPDLAAPTPSWSTVRSK